MRFVRGIRLGTPHPRVLAEYEKEQVPHALAIPSGERLPGIHRPPTQSAYLRRGVMDFFPNAAVRPMWSALCTLCARMRKADAS